MCLLGNKATKSESKRNQLVFQALCILANVADGDTAKDFIMMNEDVLKKIMNYMVSQPIFNLQGFSIKLSTKCFNFFWQIGLHLDLHKRIWRNYK